MIKTLGTVQVSKELRKLARNGYPASTHDGFTNSLTVGQLHELVELARQQGFKPLDSTATNFWGRNNVRPHVDAVESNNQLLLAVAWPSSVLFYSGNDVRSLTPGEVCLFHSNTDLHGIYVGASQRWSCIVLDVEYI